jgi:ketosteroid isomerase-like protein
MPTVERIEQFIARVEANAHAEAIAEFYTENASMRENQQAPRVGRAALIAGEQKFLSKMARVTSRCVRPVLVSGDTVVVRWIFNFVLVDGSRIDMEELAYQRWEGDRIAEEQFFYDPAQLAPKAAVGA